MFGPVPDGSEPNGHNGSAGAAAAGAVVALSVEQLHRCRNTQGDLENFVQAVRMAVTADQGNRQLTSEEVARELTLEELSVVKLGRLLAASPEGWREGEVALDVAGLGVRPSFNLHLFR